MSNSAILAGIPASKMQYYVGNEEALARRKQRAAKRADACTECEPDESQNSVMFPGPVMPKKLAFSRLQLERSVNARQPSCWSGRASWSGHVRTKVPREFRKREEEWAPENELYACELWKSQVIGLIDERIAMYVSTFEPSLHTSVLPKASRNRQTRRMRKISKVLRKVLQKCDAGTILAAGAVSTAWTDMASWIINHPGPNMNNTESEHNSPISFLHPINEKMKFRPRVLSREEYQRLEEDIETSLSHRFHTREGGLNIVYYPARMSEAANVQFEATRDIELLYEDQLYSSRDWSGNMGLLSPAQQSRKHKNARMWYYNSPGPSQPISRWLDLSQVDLNPFLRALLQDRLRLVNGRYEVMLLPLSDYPNAVIDRQAQNKEMLALVESQSVTSPPVASLTLRVWSPTVEDDENIFPFADDIVLTTVSNDSGVQVGEVLSALDEHCVEVLQYWILRARQLKDAVAANDWKHDIWFLPAAPKIIISLDSERATYDTAMYTWPAAQCVGTRKERMREWMPKTMLKPAQPTAEEADILPGIYSIGLHGDIFKPGRFT